MVVLLRKTVLHIAGQSSVNSSVNSTINVFASLESKYPRMARTSWKIFNNGLRCILYKYCISRKSHFKETVARDSLGWVFHELVLPESLIIALSPFFYSFHISISNCRKPRSAQASKIPWHYPLSLSRDIGSQLCICKHYQIKKNINGCKIEFWNTFLKLIISFKPVFS